MQEAIVPLILLAFCAICGLRAQYDLVKSLRWGDPNLLAAACSRLGYAASVYGLIGVLLCLAALLPLYNDRIYRWTPSREHALIFLLLLAIMITLILCRRTLLRVYLRHMEHVASR